MPITRTPMIDDDGSGTTGTIINNAWKQEFYNQIDAFAAAGGPVLNWTPVDASGAALTFGLPIGKYMLTGSTVLFWVHVQFPATASGLQAQIGGLPYPCLSLHGGGYTTFGLFSHLHLPQNATAVSFINPNGTNRSNAELSGSTWLGAGQYLKA